MNPEKSEWIESWHLNPSTNRNYDFIDGLRGIAILLVVGCHVIYVNPNAGPVIVFIGSLFNAGTSGVSLFFALSGFLIARPFWIRKMRQDPRVVPRGYLLRRFYKIYPPLALSLILLTPIYILRSGSWSYLSTALEWLTGVALFVPVNGGLNPVMWSLVVEVQFYLMLPILFLLARPLKAKACLWTMLGVFLLVPIAFRLTYAAYGLHATIHPNINMLFPSNLDAFALGIFVSGLHSLGLLPKSHGKLGNIGLVLLPITLLGIAMLNRTPGAFWKSEIAGDAINICGALLLCYVADPQQAAARWLCAPLLRWLGIISYEWYLFHQPLFFWLWGFWGFANGSLVKYLGIILTVLFSSLIIAALTYWYFSLPILRWGRERHRS